MSVFVRCLILTAVLALTGSAATAQTIVVSPFLQSATPNGIWIVWETSSGSESRVEWGDEQRAWQYERGR